MVIMKTGRISDAKEERLRNFWEMKAKKYPMPFDEGSLLKATEKIIEIVKQRGVVLSGKRILDIGCGTGTFALPLAFMASSVTGLDISETMIAMLNEVAIKYDVRNVDAVHTSWRDLDVSKEGFKKVYDVTWTAMSMAVMDRDDLERMEQCAKDWCVYIGWGNTRRDSLMEEVFRTHGMELKPPPGAGNIAEILQKMGRNPSLDFIETSWDWQGTVDEALEDLAGHVELEGYGKIPERKAIREIIERHAENNAVRHTTYVEEGIIVWRAS
jgi:SAM-dependent methyltransferase